MKILVFSDTHNYLDNAREVLRRIGGQMDMVLHLGDHDTDAMELKRNFHLSRSIMCWATTITPGIRPIRRWYSQAEKLLLVHGHKQRVYWNYDSISYWAEEQGADVVLFGHTHRPVYDDRGRVMLFNPGSISMPRGGTPPTFGILTIEENGRMEGAIMEYHRDMPFADVRMIFAAPKDGFGAVLCKNSFS